MKHGGFPVRVARSIRAQRPRSPRVSAEVCRKRPRARPPRPGKKSCTAIWDG